MKGWGRTRQGSVNLPMNKPQLIIASLAIRRSCVAWIALHLYFTMPEQWSCCMFCQPWGHVVRVGCRS